ncbi:MAG: hypothetical protein II711_01445 [Clostridia bacterium]|nr:hypothetical protein [Clostridia bacterium]
MSEIVSKTDNFLKAIEKYAEKQRNKIQSEAEDFKKRELNKAEEDGLREAYVLLQRKMAELKLKISGDLSKAEGESKKKIFLRRKEIADEVFLKAENKLKEYTQSSQYTASLEKSTRLIAEKLTEDDTVLLIGKNDVKHKKKIAEAFGRNCEIKETDEITIGGIMGVSHKLGLLVDETLDTRLEEQHEWFYANSGLSVTD